MRTAWWVVLVSLVSPVANAAPVLLLREPGYLAIDGIYYLLDLPRYADVSHPIELHARNEAGFFLRAWVAADGCEHAAPSEQQGSLLEFSELLDQGAAPRIELQNSADQSPRITLAHCEGVAVLLANTQGADTRCTAAVPFPFRRGQCSGLDKADRRYVFLDNFERR